MQKSKLIKHQKKMVRAIRNLDLQTLEEMSSFYLPDAMLTSANKYRSEINKRLNRIFPFSLQRAKIPFDELFKIAEDFHFDHPSKTLQKIITNMAKRIKNFRPADPVLDDLLNIEKTLAFIYYSNKKKAYDLHGIPIQLKTTIWKSYPDTEKVVPNQSLIPLQMRFDFDPYLNEVKFYPDPFADGRLTEQGDPHNFGKKTTAKTAKTFHKPRELFWEYFLYSKNSPLKNILPSKLAKALFPLDISLTLQTSKKINKLSKGQISPDFWRNTGYLCAWSSLFGVTDLHRGNIIVTKQGPVAIDIETAFLPQPGLEFTGLIGADKDPLKWSTGLAGLYEISRNGFSSSNLKALLEGFTFVLQWALNNHSKLSGFIQKNQATINACANRFIVRDSRFYENPRGKFIPEERIQLTRNDVPFFFTYRDKTGIHYQVDPFGGSSKIKSIPSASKGLLALHNSPLSATLSKRRIKKLLRESPAKLIKYFGYE